MERILLAGKSIGLIPKVHVNQFSTMGGVESAIKLGALSVDHLEELSNQDLMALKESTCMPTFLPGCSHFLGIPFGRATALINEGIPFALASDFNPGSAPSGNMGRVVQMGMVKMKMHPLEAIAAATINGAAAMGLEHAAGTITPGRSANLILTKPMDGLETMGYAFGEELVEKVFIGGQEQ